VSHSNGVTSRSWMTHLPAGRHRSVMARPIRPSMLVGVTPRLHPEMVRSRNETTSSLLFTAGSSHVEIVRVNMRHHPTVRPYGRLKLLGAGLALTVVGIAMLLRGVQVVTHWTGQPMFSWGLIAAGGLCILLALIPTSRIANAATTHSKTARHR